MMTNDELQSCNDAESAIVGRRMGSLEDQEESQHQAEQQNSEELAPGKEGDIAHSSAGSSHQQHHNIKLLSRTSLMVGFVFVVLATLLLTGLISCRSTQTLGDPTAILGGNGTTCEIGASIMMKTNTTTPFTEEEETTTAGLHGTNSTHDRNLLCAGYEDHFSRPATATYTPRECSGWGLGHRVCPVTPACNCWDACFNNGENIKAFTELKLREEQGGTWECHLYHIYCDPLWSTAGSSSESCTDGLFFRCDCCTSRVCGAVCNNIHECFRTSCT